MWKRGLAVLGAIAISTVGMTQAHAQQTFGWAPKPAQLTPYTGVNQPLTRLSDVIANRDPAVSWRQKIVDEPNVSADYVGMAVGTETRPSLSADHRTAFIVWAGDIEVTIQGQPTFMAKKGTMIQVPHRNEYKLKNVGTAPSLHFEIYVTDHTDLYLQNSATLPPPPAGDAWYLSRIDAPDVWTRPGQPTKPVFRHYLDSPSAQEFVNNDRLFVNAIRGQSTSLPPATDLGHFHVYGGEFWFIIEGTMGYLIEGMPYFTAGPGDVVYAAKGRWHRAGNHPNTGLGTRVAINGYPRGAHLWQQTNPPAVPPVQVLPPSTRAALSSITSNGSYLQPTVTLSGYPHADSPSDDLEYSEYWLDGAPQSTRYAGPFQIRGNGVHTLSYRSVDKAGNVEPPKTLAVGVIDLPPLTLQVVPSTLNLRTAAGLVTTVISVPAGYDLRQWGVSDVRAEGTPAVSAAYSADGRTIVATFNKAALGSVPAGNQVKITVTGQFSYNGAQAPMVASAQVQVIR
nr:cupin domain-containing protein [Schlegelella koreensis]